MRFKTVMIVVVALALLASVSRETARASTIEYTSLAAFTAATTSLSYTGFNGILGPGDGFLNFGTLTLGDISFSTPNSGTFVNVTASNFYPANGYPADFIVDSFNPGPDNVLTITFASPTYAVGLDFGGFSGGAFGLALSNGFIASEGSSPTLGATEFMGFVSTDPITGLQLTLFNDSWVVLDVVQATPVPVPEPASFMLLGGGLVAIGGLLVGRKRERAG